MSTDKDGPFTRRLLSELDIDIPEGGFPEFKPCIIYLKSMDWLDFLFEDCSYRAQWLRVIPVTLLWRSHEWKLVGIRLEGASHFVPKDVLAALV